jgi:carotenoid cleavage dioxygenase-like enzyme
VSAHPKVDQRTGELISFGYNFFGEDGGYLKYSLFNKRKQLVNSLNIPIRGPVMIHDIAITKDYVIFGDLPMQFKPNNIT